MLSKILTFRFPRLSDRQKRILWDYFLKFFIWYIYFYFRCLIEYPITTLIFTVVTGSYAHHKNKEYCSTPQGQHLTAVFKQIRLRKRAIEEIKLREKELLAKGIGSSPDKPYHKDVLCPTKNHAFQLAKLIDKYRKPVLHDPHKIGQYPHYHPGGHILIQINGLYINYHLSFGPIWVEGEEKPDAKSILSEWNTWDDSEFYLFFETLDLFQQKYKTRTQFYKVLKYESAC